MGAEQREVREVRLATVSPVFEVMRVHVASVMAAWERAAPVARPECTLERCRDRPLLTADIQWRASIVLDDRDQAPVAGQTLDRVDREVRASNPSAEGFLVD